MFYFYLQCFEDASVVTKEYAVQYPNRARYLRKLCLRISNYSREIGLVRRVCYSYISQKENTINVLAYVEADRNISVRELSRHLGLSACGVQNYCRNTNTAHIILNFTKLLRVTNHDQTVECGVVAQKLHYWAFYI